ncbi:hypothetical protein ASPZODRAFT_56139 [Penicilliopsis zonata CBS 506.65]|uniref:Kinetochore protein mis14 n=1 Tax=Penicilliopsis zonata CBS 506.65 TaxID=1073090 RepID=A0A1L9SW60_9EURO|nr:hypothetical protein ASPZODRAFT_56139 [Penicilliopsis zonata CBS 506.65]OJJ51445.1 hypothetical protein ASPZODRAFT_56139 [Penicilliopsis zonata CBS 506.65]
MAHYRKIELQSAADFTYLYANTVALSRRKLDLHLPLSATNDDTPDPMRERVREHVDEFINRTFGSAASSVSINGIDSTSPQFPFPASFTTTETVEYEAYDSDLAARVTSLYAQLESLTTTVAQLRRDTPSRAAREYAAQLKRVLEDEDEEDKVEVEVEEKEENDNKEEENTDVDMQDTQEQSRRRKRLRPADWTLHVPLGTDHEAERWQSGEMAEVYEDALRTLLRLQGEVDGVPAEKTQGQELDSTHALATTVGKTERAARAAEVVEKI